MSVITLSNPTVIRPVIKLAQLFSSEMGIKLANRALCGQSKERASIKPSVSQFDLTTTLGIVKVYKLGEGTPIWIIPNHQESTDSYLPLMQALYKKHVASVTFEFPKSKKGISPYQQLQQHIEMLNEIGNQLLKPKALVCHSLGALTLANTHWISRFSGEITLIAPCYDYFAYMGVSAKKIGLTDKSTKTYLQRLGSNKSDKHRFKHTFKRLKHQASKITVVHDRNNSLYPYSASEAFCNMFNANLVTTRLPLDGKLSLNKPLVRQIISTS